MFRIIGEGIKVHWASNPEVAADVMKNLMKRMGKQTNVTEVTNRRNFYYDPGNVFIDANEPIFCFELPDMMNIVIRSQHWFDFVEDLKNNFIDDTRSRNVYDNEFFKLHNENNVLCFSVEQRTFLIKKVLESKDLYSRMSREYWKHIGGSFHDEEYLLTV